MENVHYIIIGILISGLVFYQVKIHILSKSKIKEFKGIFPITPNQYNKVERWVPNSDIDTLNLKDFNKFIDEYSKVEIDDTLQVTLIEIHNNNKILIKIKESINTYLLRNKGAASDFHLIKDIVERNCDAAEDEVATELPMPLYLGLMGTMVGIIIGIGSIALTGGGFNAFIDNPGESIGILMGGVAVAMISSLIGIFITTIGSWDAKNAKAILESTKNDFYTWIQTELLPDLSKNTTNSLHILQSNLSKFNSSFSTNIAKLDSALSEMGSSFKDQLELMKAIESLDIKQMSKANVIVLKELQNSTREFERFNCYMHNVNDYLDKVNRLNDNVNLHLNRTGAIERMGKFFESEIQQIEQRKSSISLIVGSIDDVLKKSFNELKENSENQIGELKMLSVINQDEFKKAAEEQQEALKSKLQETTILMNELKNLSAVRISMEKLESATHQQNNKLEDLSSSIKELIKTIKVHDNVDNSHTVHVNKIAEYIKYTCFGSGAIIGVGYIGYNIINWSIVLYKFLF